MLKPNRIEDPYGQRINFYFNDPNPSLGFRTVAERGGVSSRLAGTSPTSSSPGDPGNQAAYAADPTIVTPIGMLLYDVVSYDTNRQHENWYKSGFQARAGMKVAHDKRGTYATNMIPSGVTNITADQPAFLAANGLVSNIQATSGVSGVNKAPQVGTWKSSQDSDGYAVIDLFIA